MSDGAGDFMWNKLPHDKPSVEVTRQVDARWDHADIRQIDV